MGLLASMWKVRILLKMFGVTSDGNLGAEFGAKFGGVSKTFLGIMKLLHYPSPPQNKKIHPNCPNIIRKFITKITTHVIPELYDENLKTCATLKV